MRSRAATARVGPGIAAAVLLALAALAGTTADAARADTARADTARADTATTHVMLDFENGDVGAWRYAGDVTVGDWVLSIRWMQNRDKNNSSSGVLHCAPGEGRQHGNLTFFLRENGIEPFPLTRRTRVAWNWKVSSVANSNGFWLVVGFVDRSNGNRSNVRYANWVKYTHRATVYYDHPQVWCYHVGNPFTELSTMLDDLRDGQYEVESISLMMAYSPDVEAWIDNVWSGEGDPPRSVNVSSRAGESIETVSSRLTGFSYGDLDHDGVPDRVDIYPDRVEILLDSNVQKDAGRGGHGSARYAPMSIVPPVFQRIRLDPQRGTGTASIADLDGDGNNDILLGFDDGGGTVLLRNRWPRGRFVSVAPDSDLEQRGQHSYGSVMSDVDLDGDLDVLLLVPFCGAGQASGVRLIRNDGAAEFTDVTNASGVHKQGAFSAAFADVDGDGAPDLFVGYMTCPRTDGVADRYAGTLFINDGRGVFEEARDRLPIPDVLRISGEVFADFDNDGDLDLYISVFEVTGGIHPPSNRLLLNDGDGFFTDVTQESNTGCEARSAGALAGDFDNDGWVDIFVINRGSRCILYRNTGSARFEDFTSNSTLIFNGDASGGTATDIDGDGDTDVVLLKAGSGSISPLENAIGGQGHWLDVELRGIHNNRSGLGGTVRVYEAGHLGEERHLLGYREVSHGGGEPQRVPPVAHFGLGKRDVVDIVVEFPRVGASPTLKVERAWVAADRAITVSEYRSWRDRVAHSETAEWLWGSAVRRLGRIPAWLVIVTAFGLVVGAGVHHRSSVSALERRVTGVLLGGAAVVSVAAALIRSWQWAAAVLAVAVVHAVCYRQMARTALRLVPGAIREELEDAVLRMIWRFNHAEAEFSMFKDLEIYPDDVVRRLVAGATDVLSRVVFYMRVLAPGDARTRLIRGEIVWLRSMSGNRDAPLPLDAILDARDRITNHLAAYREVLRWRLSIDFCAAWEAFEATVAPQAAAAGIHLETTPPSDLTGVRVHMRRSEFDALFKNLFSNSAKAMSGREDRRIKVEFDAGPMFLTVRWADTGPGIAGDIGGVPCEEPVKSTTGGSGQGLFRSRTLLRERGDGDLWVDRSGDGEGAAFKVRLLVVEPPYAETRDN